MRNACLVVSAALGLCLLAHPAAPAPVAPAPAAATPQSNIVPVDKRCGAGRHYAASHRNKAGVLVKGRCVRNRRPAV